jgi:hypothetical protein
MTTTLDRTSPLALDQLTALLAAAGDPVAAHGFDHFRAFDPDAQLQLLQRMQQRFGSLKSWSEHDLDMSLLALYDADMADVERVHQARLRHMEAALGRAGTSTRVDPMTLGIEPDGPPPGEALDYAVIHGRPVGQGLLPVDQVIYALAPLDTRPVLHPCPDVVFWIDGGAVVAHGTVTGHRTRSLIVHDEVAVCERWSGSDTIRWRGGGFDLELIDR